MKADNFDPAVRKIKGEDWCRGKQSTCLLATSSLLSLCPLSLHSLGAIMKFFCPLFRNLFFVQHNFLFSFTLVPPFIFPLPFFSTPAWFVWPLKFALHSVIISCLSKRAMVPKSHFWCLCVCGSVRVHVRERQLCESVWCVWMWGEVTVAKACVSVYICLRDIQFLSRLWRRPTEWETWIRRHTPPLVKERMSRADNALLSPPPPPHLLFLHLTHLCWLPNTPTQSHKLCLLLQTHSLQGGGFKLDLVVVEEEEQGVTILQYPNCTTQTCTFIQCAKNNKYKYTLTHPSSCQWHNSLYILSMLGLIT